MPDTLKRAFLAPDGILRPIWRVLLFYVLGTFLVFAILGWPLVFITKTLRLAPGLTAANVSLAELRNFLTALICTAVFAFYEHRHIDSYGLALRRAWSWQTFEGTAAGIVMAAAVALGMIVLGGMQVAGFAGKAHTLALSALAWLGTNILVGIAEEFWFRSYIQFTLWKSIGFLPSAAAIALVFAAEHYFFKPGENVWDVITLVSLSLLLSYSLLRTGTLWFAVGFHFAYDYMQLFVIGTPNGSRVPVGRLLNVQFAGPAWLTGGVLGTEASFLMYPAIALLWVYVWWRYRNRAPLQP